MSSLNYSELCRLCLVKERVSIPIFDGEGEERQVFLKIAACLPVKVCREDKFPKNICDACLYKVENQYQFWNTAANSEKQLLQWFGDATIGGNEHNITKTNARPMETNLGELKQESVDLDHSSELSKSLSRVEAVLAEEAGRAAAEEEDESDEGSNSEESDDDDNDADEPSKDDNDSDEAYDEELEPTTFVNVSLACDEAGPSGTQRQTAAPSTSTSAPAASGASNLKQPAATGVIPKNGIKPKRKKKKIVKPVIPITPSNNIRPPVTQQEFKCTLGNCDITYNNAYSYALHMKTHGPNTPTVLVSCSVCKQTFTSNERLRVHMLSHTKSRMVPFDYVPKSFECDLCSKNFGELNKLNKHKVTHNPDRPFKCEVCDKRFKRRFEVVKHNKIHTKQKDYFCTDCDYATTNKTYLEYHKMRKHLRTFDYICDLCGKRLLTPTDLTNHKITHEEKKFSCPDCSKCFYRKSHLLLHSQTHNPNRGRAQCDLCGKTFATKSVLVRHMIRHLSPDKYKCEECHKVLTSASSLVVHRRRHSGEKPFACDICLKFFRSIKYVEIHKRVHTGEKPYQCLVCSKTFTQRSTLTIHSRYHSGMRFSCDYHSCNKAFVTKTLLTAHQKSHDP